MFCKHCGQSVDDDAKFCIHCGQAIGTNQPGPPDAAAEPKMQKKKNRGVIIGIIAGLLLTAVCTPLALAARKQVLSSPLNPQNRVQAAAPRATANDIQPQNETTASAPSPTSSPTAGEELVYPNLPMVFASDRGDPNYEQCHPDNSCWLQVFYTPAAQTEPAVNLTGPLGFISATEPVLSPDGSRIAFTGYPKEGSTNHIYLINTDGSGLRVMTLEGFNHGHASWSPDGTRLVIMSKPTTETYYNLYLIDVETRKATQLTSGNYQDRFPEFSPDGLVVAFHSNRSDPDPANCYPNCQTNPYQVVIETGKGHEITSSNGSIEAAGLAWSPDGSQLAFHSRLTGNWEIYIMNLDGSIYQLTDNPGVDTFPSWSPNGKFIAYNSEGANGFDIVVTPTDNFLPKIYLAHPGRDQQPDW